LPPSRAAIPFGAQLQAVQWQPQTQPTAGAQPAGAFTLSVIVPVLNEERGLAQLIARLEPVLMSTGADWEIIFVDDGSTDDTLLKLAELHDANARIKAISLSRNFGKEIAVAAGLSYAKSDAVILMDADLQHPPEMIPEFIADWRAGYDIVYGVRRDRYADSFARRMFARVFYKAFKLMSGTRLPKGAGDFRLLSHRAATALNRIGERARFNKGLYAWIGFKSKGIPFDVPERAAGGGSRWRLRPLARFALDGVASFSTVPLRVSSYLGLAISLFAFSYALAFAVKTLIFGADIKGFPTLVVSIMFFSGAQMISLGIIGEYLGRVYDEVKARPLFLVADELGLEGRVDAERMPAHPGAD
jgi:polyisoprenyl-phosphate glycosyltransferase